MIALVTGVQTCALPFSLLLRQRDANPLHDRRVGVDMGDRGVADGADGDLGACENQRYARRFLVHRRLAPQAARAEIVAVIAGIEHAGDRKSTRLNSSHYCASRMPSSACKKKTTHKLTHTIE